ncbi:MAG: hypothetical protein GWN32_08475, partial [Gemmatimonadetes bacterium]|nr:hypothetical protein [Gemmatimonadota bacterium]
EIDREVSRVRIISSEAARRAEGHDNPFARLTAITGFLFDELGYRGNLKNFNDPRNCYLNEVLNRHLGIPITLSVLVIEAAR